MKKIVKGLGVFFAFVPFFLGAAQEPDKEITRNDLYAMIDILRPEGYNGRPYSHRECFQNADDRDLVFLTGCQIYGATQKNKNLIRHLETLGDRLEKALNKSTSRGLFKKKGKKDEPDPFKLVVRVETILNDMEGCGYVQKKPKEPEWWSTVKWCAVSSFVTAVWASLAWAEASDAQEL